MDQENCPAKRLKTREPSASPRPENAGCPREDEWATLISASLGGLGETHGHQGA